jgi:hypothetical protein
VRVETKLHLSAQSKKGHENKGLKNERQITLYRLREAAKRDRAERRVVEAHAREVEAYVRHLNLGLVERVVFVLICVGLTVAFISGALHEEDLLKIALGTSGLGGAFAASRGRLGRPRNESTQQSNSPDDHSERPLL